MQLTRYQRMQIDNLRASCTAKELPHVKALTEDKEFEGVDFDDVKFTGYLNYLKSQTEEGMYE